MEQPLPRILSLTGPWLICAAEDDAASIEDRPDASAAWQTINVPAAVQQALGSDFHGKAWLRRQIELPDLAEATERWWLAFKAVATDCHVWIEGTFIGRHTGDYVPFEFDISPRCAGHRSIDVTLLIDQMHATPPDRDGDLQRGYITKGFHDVLSIQHAGVWDDCYIALTGPVRIMPDGVRICADATTGELAVHVSLETHESNADCIVRILDSEEGEAAAAQVVVPPGRREVTIRTSINDCRRWSPARPHLYRVEVEVEVDKSRSDQRSVSFGFRTICTEGHTILLNDEPLFLRGVLHWGHEPRHIAPAPTEDEIRADFARLRSMGVNCVCLCMWYPPRRYFEIADDAGMLIWQEHPVWQSAMDNEHVSEYQQHYRAFMQRDANHPSIVIVSATCEHPRFNENLARWWWETARVVLADKLLQVQTAFFKWADLERTHLYDEHAYDGSDRWACYVDDVQHELTTLPIKPFVMGETIVFSSWPQVSGIHDRIGHERPWWLPRAFDHMIELQRHWANEYGKNIVERFRNQSIRFALLSRQFQVEQFRRHAANAGLVMNHINDVPAGQFGFRDDLGNWRFESNDVSPWLADTSLLLWTPDHRRGFIGGGTIACRLAVSNFGQTGIDANAIVRIAGAPRRARDPFADTLQTRPLACAQGAIGSVEIDLPLPPVETPTRMQVDAQLDGVPGNSWDLWLLPRAGMKQQHGAYRLDALPFTESERAPDDVERGYSRGYGIATRSWRSVVPDPAVIAPTATAWSGGEAIPDDCRVLLTHRLTHRIINWLEFGGRTILFASKGAGALGTTYESLYGQMPLIIERGPLQPGDSEWLLDMLVYDLIRLHSRVIPSEQLGIVDHVDPLIRCVYTHDQKDRVRFFDQLFMTRVGDGLLIASSLDHHDDAGRHLLDRLIDYLLRDDAHTERAIEMDKLRTQAIEAT